MNDTLIDIGGSLIAVSLCAPVVVLPGFALAGGAGCLGFWKARAGGQLRLALIAAFALLPAIDSLVARLLGLGPALWLNLALAVAGVVVLRKTRRRWGERNAGGARPRLAWAAAFALWIGLIGYAYWDFEIGGRLYQSLADTDMVKHAATIQALVDTGAPPADPFVARPGPSGYYYFFYTLGALVDRLGCGWVDARAAFIGVTVWVGPALAALACEVLVRCGYARETADAADALKAPPALRRYFPLLIALLLVSALDILPIVLLGAGGKWFPTLGAWNEEVTPWLQSLIWVPHHITGLIAIWAGLLALEEAARPQFGGRGHGAMQAIVYAALAFASAAGASVWVTLAGVGAVGLWLVVLAWARRWRAMALVLSAGVVAGVVFLPQLHDLAIGRNDHAFPIALTVRDFKMLDQVVHPRFWRAVGRVLLLPLNYGLEFGLFALGGALFLHRADRGDVWDRDVPRLLTLTALSGALLGTFARSTIIYNDLGWRVMLFPQLTLLVWTAVALRRQLDNPPSQSRKPSPILLGGWALLLLFGYLTTGYALFGLRGYRVLTPPKFIFASALDPAIHDQLRTAYAWLGRHAPPRAVVQQNPTPTRVVDFGLYGRNRVAVADKDATLYGAPKALVQQRLAILGPVFTTDVAAAQAASAAKTTGVDFLIAKATDPVWAARRSWVWAVQPIYATPMVRIVSVKTLGGVAATTSR